MMKSGQRVIFLLLLMLCYTHTSENQEKAEQVSAYARLFSFSQPKRVAITNNTSESIFLEISLTAAPYLASLGCRVKYSLPEGVEIVRFNEAPRLYRAGINKIKIYSLSNDPVTTTLHFRQKVTLETGSRLILQSFHENVYYSDVWLENLNIFLNFALDSEEVVLIADLFRSPFDLINTTYCQNTLKALTASDYSYVKHGNVPYHPYIFEKDKWKGFRTLAASKLYSTSVAQQKKNIAMINTNSLRQYLSTKLPPRAVIPHLTHRLWITSESDPYEAPKDTIYRYLDSVRNFSMREGHGNWTHYFWCVDKRKIPRTIRLIEESHLNIQIHEIKEIYSRMKTRYLYDAFLKENLFCIASDGVRYEIVNLFGGVYCDLGIRFKKSITDIVDRFSHLIIGLEHRFDIQVIGAAKNDRLLSIYLEKLSNITTWGKLLFPDHITLLMQLSFFRCQHFTTVLDCFATEQDSIAVLGPQFVEFYSMRSWGVGRNTTKFGNEAVSKSKLNIFELKKE